MKIIQILHHSHSPFEIDTDIKYYEDDWHVRVAKKIKKLSNYEVECWRPERTFSKKYVRTGEDGITYRIFPSKYINFKFELSIPLIKELKSLSKKEKILVHIHGLYSLNTYSILQRAGSNIPVVAQSHGAGPPSLLAFKKSKHPLKFIHILEYQLQRSFKNVDQFFCLNEEEKNELSRIYSGKAIIQPMGINFNNFKPIQKNIALKKIKLEDKYYFICVGRLNKDKGLNYLFKGLKKFILKSELPASELSLLLIGEGPYKNELISLARDLGILEYIKFLGQIKNDLLPYYYNAADLTIFPSLSESFGVVPVESLACKTPIISTNVGAILDITKNFRGGSKIIPIKSSESVYNSINKLFYENIGENEIDRENAHKYYDWNIIIKNTIEIYDKLLNKYYK